MYEWVQRRHSARCLLGRLPEIWKALLHWLINYIGTKAKKCWWRQCNVMSSKNLPVLGLRYRCLSEFIDWRYSQSSWYFRASFVNVAPPTFSLVELSTLPSLLCVNKYTVSSMNLIFLLWPYTSRRFWWSDHGELFAGWWQRFDHLRRGEAWRPPPCSIRSPLAGT